MAVVAIADTAVDESRKDKAHLVAKPPARLCSRDGTLCYYRRLEYDSLAVRLVFLFVSFFSSSPPSCRPTFLLSLVRISSSV